MGRLSALVAAYTLHLCSMLPAELQEKLALARQYAADNHETLSLTVPMYLSFHYVVGVIAEGCERLSTLVDHLLLGFDAWEIVLLTAAAIVFYMIVSSAIEGTFEDGVLPTTFRLLRRAPLIRGYLAQEKAKLKATVLKQRQEQHAHGDKQANGHKEAPSYTRLPEKGADDAKVLGWLRDLASSDLVIQQSKSQL
jgi:hypothetical protein